MAPNIFLLHQLNLDWAVEKARLDFLKVIPHRAGVQFEVFRHEPLLSPLEKSTPLQALQKTSSIQAQNRPRRTSTHGVEYAFNRLGEKYRFLDNTIQSEDRVAIEVFTWAV
ncbi:MAG: hypothetical protein JJV98_00845 [Desulfosarcina sp.]|nr:hypothetical protein [Desulfobacterales bacterium]